MAVNRVSLTFLCLLLVSAVSGDINDSRKKALRELEALADDAIVVGNKSNEALKTIPNRLSSVYFLVKTQGENIKNHNILEIEDETKVAYKKAEIMGSSNAVYGCIGHAMNDGETKIRDNFYVKFTAQINEDNAATTNAQTNTINAWKKKVDAQEAVYRKQYQDSVKEISEIKEEQKLGTIVARFTAFTTQMNAVSKEILGTLQKLQLDFLNRMQVVTTNLRTNLIETKNRVFADIKACHNLKFVCTGFP